MRPGVLNAGVVDYLLRSGHTLVLWNVICEDWRRPDSSWVDRALAGSKEQSWSLIVLHDIASGAMNHLSTFLDRVAEAEIDVVAVVPPAQVPIRGGSLR